MEIEEGSGLYVGILLILAVIFLLIGIKLPLFYLLSWFIAWYGAFIVVNNTTESMIFITYLLFGIFALVCFALQLLYSRNNGEGR